MARATSSTQCWAFAWAKKAKAQHEGPLGLCRFEMDPSGDCDLATAAACLQDLPAKKPKTAYQGAREVLKQLVKAKQDTSGCLSRDPIGKGTSVVLLLLCSLRTEHVS